MKNLFFKNTSRLMLATTLLTTPVFAGHDLIEGEEGENFDAIRGITVSKPTCYKLDVEAEDGKADIQVSIYTFDVEVEDEKADIQAAIKSENHPLWDSQARVYFCIEGSQSLDHLPPVLSRLEHLNLVYIQCTSYDFAYFEGSPESTLDLSCLSGFKGFNITISGYTNIDSTPLCGASTAEFSDIHTLTGEKELVQKGVDVTVDSNWLKVDQKEESANNANTETREL